MNFIYWILIAVILLNTFGAIVTVFHESRDISTTWAWLLVLVLLPVVGFILYLFTGRGISKEKLFNIKEQDRVGLVELLTMQQADNLRYVDSKTDEITADGHILVDLFKNTDQAPLTKRNLVKFYTDGEKKFAALFADIKQAKKSVHVEYYSFYADDIGTKFLHILEEKAAEGVEVRLIYDPYGSIGTNKTFFKKLLALGGQVAPFVTSKNMITKFRLNYHLHRKIVVIDGKIGYTGGFNVGDQYLGRKEKFGYWRDTHMKIIGTGVLPLQIRYFMDWNASAKPEQRLNYTLDYFPHPDADLSGDTSLQIVSSGPDDNLEQIKHGYMKMISIAQERVWLQTPYLIPDDSMLSTLTIAAQAGIDVRIMIPCMPDHPFIYRATQFYAKQLQKVGVKIYIYDNGFIHAKTMTVDGKIASVGSANQDFRSYKLNFEVNAFLYDEVETQLLEHIFEDDMKHCHLLTKEEIDNWSFGLTFRQNFSRLLSPIL